VARLFSTGKGNTPGSLQSPLKPSNNSGQLGLSPAATAAASSSGTSGTSTDSQAAITANDFLTLLVTEMQNQDPTAQTDPNAYVDQLVQINSLEQLIAMNQNLALVLGTVTSPVPTGGAAPTAGTASVGTASSATQSSMHPTVAGARLPQSSVPGDIGAASRSVARSLDGHVPQTQRGHAIRDFPMH